MILKSKQYEIPQKVGDEITPEMTQKWMKIIEKMVTQNYYFMVEMFVQLGVSIDGENALAFYKIAMEAKNGKMV